MAAYDLNSVSNKDIMDGLSKLGSDGDLMNKVTQAVASDPTIKSKVPELANDPRMRGLAEDARKNISLSEAKKMKKNVNKAISEQKKKIPKLEGVMINIGRKLKPYIVEVLGGSVSEKQIGTSLNARKLQKDEIGDYIVYHDSLSPKNNKKINSLFPGAQLGNTIIIFRKDSLPLTIEEVMKMEKKENIEQKKDVVV